MPPRHKRQATKLQSLSRSASAVTFDTTGVPIRQPPARGAGRFAQMTGIHADPQPPPPPPNARRRDPDAPGRRGNRPRESHPSNPLLPPDSVYLVERMRFLPHAPAAPSQKRPLAGHQVAIQYANLLQQTEGLVQQTQIEHGRLFALASAYAVQHHLGHPSAAATPPLLFCLEPYCLRTFPNDTELHAHVFTQHRSFFEEQMCGLLRRDPGIQTQIAECTRLEQALRSTSAELDRLWSQVREANTPTFLAHYRSTYRGLPQYYLGVRMAIPAVQSQVPATAGFPQPVASHGVPDPLLQSLVSAWLSQQLLHRAPWPP